MVGLRRRGAMPGRWLYAWGLASVAYGGASLIVPLYVVELGGGAPALGLLFATGSFVGVPGSLVFGRLADRTGRRRVFVLGALSATAASMAAIPALTTIPAVIAVNALLWLGFAAAVPVLTLLAVAGAPEPEWSGLIGRLNRFQGVGWALGLLVGFLVVAGGSWVAAPVATQRAFFLVCAVAAAGGLAVGLRTLPPDPAPGTEPRPRRLRRRIREAAAFNVRGAAFPFTPAKLDPRALHPRRFAERFTPALAVYFGAVVLAFAGFGMFFAPLPAYLGALGYGAGEIFGLYLALNAAAAAFYGRAAALAGRYSPERVNAAGFALRGVAFPAVVAVGAALGSTALGLGAAAAVFAVIGGTWAVIAVVAATLVSGLSPPAIRGEALGVYGALGALAGGVGGLAGGWLGAASYPLAFAVAGGLVLAGAGVVLWLSRDAG
ncbi:MAG: MFS transporter [Halobacteriaceae archaeon]